MPEYDAVQSGVFKKSFKGPFGTHESVERVEYNAEKHQGKYTLSTGAHSTGTEKLPKISNRMVTIHTLKFRLHIFFAP